MDSGLTRFFLRKRSKRKPLLISEPLPDTFRQTAGYNDFANGRPPTIGTRPIKPSEQKIKRKSFSHLRTKSVGLQEFRQMVHRESEARPQTASGIPPASINSSDPSKSRQQPHASHGEPHPREKSSQAPPKIPNLPKGLAEMGPKYFDLLEAAVSSSRAKTLPKSARNSFDFYNETIADRNSLYGKPLDLTPNNHLSEATITHRDNTVPPTETVDFQRASFDAMRASRTASTLASRTATESIGETLPRSSPVQVSDAPTHYVPENTTMKNLQGSDRKASLDFVPPVTPSESRQLKRNSVKRDLPRQLSPILQGETSQSALPAHSSSSLLDGSKRLSARRRSKTAPIAPSSSSVSDGPRIEKPAVLTLKPFKDESKQMTANDDIPLPSESRTLSKTQSSSATRDLMLANQPPGSASDNVHPRVSSDRSKRRRDKTKRPSHDLSMALTRVIPEKISSVKGSVRKGIPSPRTGIDSTGGDPGRHSDVEDENDYDVGIEEAVTHQADPVQILRASVVSANGYVYKGGDDVILGKILQHSRSRGLPRVESTGQLPPAGDVNLGTGPEGRDSTSPLISESSPSPPHMSESASRHQLQRTKTAVSISGVAHHSPDPITATKRPEYPSLAGDSLRCMPPGTTQLPAFTQAKVDIPVRTKSSPASNPPAIIPQHTGILPISGSGANVPSSPRILTRDFALPQPSLPANPPEAIGGHQSGRINDSYGPIKGRDSQDALGGYIHIERHELDSQSSDLDQIIAIKKKAAAKALLRLQEVMAMPTWEEPTSPGRSRASTKVPSHWRDLSIEDGSPIAPSAIFNKVKIPALTPALSKHSVLPGYEKRGLGQPPGRSTKTTAEGSLDPSLQAAVDHAMLSDVKGEDVTASVATSDSPQPPWLEKRGTSDTAVPTLKKSHSRVGSTMSATSGTSAYSLPYHMVPARGSSMRDSVGGIDGFGEPAGFHVGELGWH
jgi:hypothetical protein